MVKNSQEKEASQRGEASKKVAVKDAAVVENLSVLIKCLAEA